MIVAVLALVVFVGVNWRLHDKGISMTSDYQCGLKEHKHTEECYKKVLICGKEETDGSEGHTHTDACYEEKKTLACGKEEHKHNADCYDEDGNLICDKEEHEHSEDCYTTEKELVCGKKESEPVEAHHHTDACYKKELVCGLEEHTHTAACYSNESADVEDKSDWEATIPELSGNWAEDLVSVAQSQLGYEESTANFKLADDGETRQGYTRYGEWYGNKYGDWSAMFASFCLNYAGIPAKTVPVNSGCTAWITELKEQKLYKVADDYKPVAGDLVFVDTDKDDQADHVGIITKVEKEDGKVISVKAIVGDSSDKVEENTYEADETEKDVIIGYCALPENPDEKKVDEADTTESESTTETTGEEKTEAEVTTETKATSEADATTEKAKATTEKSEEKTESTEATTAESKAEEKKTSETTTEAQGSGESTEEAEATTSEKEDLVTESDALVSVQKIEEVSTTSIAVQDTDNDVATANTNTGNATDFGQYITSSSIKKLNGNTWVDAKELQDGDQVKVRLDYKIPADVVTADNRTITYQLPDGVKLNADEQGIVSGTINNVYYENLGTYTITKDGQISITFNDTFLKTNQEFTGYIEFQGTASNTNKGDNKDIIFGADGTKYTIKPKPVNEDLSVKKTATKLENGKIRYTITASSENGTGTDKVKISDSLSFSGLNPDKVTISGVTVKDKNGNDVSYNMSAITSNSTSKSFDITDLPPLEENGTYTITYDVDYGEAVGNGFSSLNNTATGYKGNDWKSQDSVYTELSKKMIEKSGWATDSNTKIQWSIKVNPDKLTGVKGEYTLSDILKENGQNVDLDLASAEGFTIKKTDSNWQTTDVTKTAYKDGKLTIEDGCTYEITYKTPVKEGNVGDKFTYDNTASIDGNGKDYSDGGTVGVTVPSILKKEGRGTQDGTVNDTAIANWKATLNLVYFIGNTITYEDTLMDNDENKNDNIHYTTVKQLRETLNLSCEVTNDNKEKKITDYTLACYDKDGNVVTADDDKVVSFKIELSKPENGKNLFVYYSTTMNTKDLEEDATLRVKNEATFNGKTAHATNDYKKVKRLYKYGGQKDSNGNISYGSGSTSVDYDAQDGKLYYRIIVKPQNTESFTITDNLPEGVILNPEDVNVRIYYDDYNIKENTWNGDYSMADHRPEIKVDGQKVEFVFAKGFPSGIGFCIDYAVSIDDSFWDNMKNSNKTYSNTVIWNAKTETQETTVTRDNSVVTKQAEQLVGTDGKKSNKVKYYVTINPAGDKLNNGRNLTLTDTMSVDGVIPELKLSSVKLYSYNGKNKKDHYKGQELSETSFTFKYDENEKTFTATVPDQTSCVLEYEYEIDYNDKNSATLGNNVKLIGRDTESSNNQISIQAASSSAAATKGDVLEIIKVDSQHYQIELSGAEFVLNFYKDSKWTEGTTKYETGANGNVYVPSKEINKNQLYAIEEVTAPANYTKTDKQYCFVWLDNKNADEWWNDNGNNLKDKKGNALKKSDIYFITNHSGTVIVPNQYSKLEVKKLWRDTEGNPIQLNDDTKITVRLKKAKQRPATGYKVTINYYYLGNNNEKIKSEKYSDDYIVRKNGRITITMMGGWENKNIVSVPEGWTYQDNNNPVTVTSNEITKDNQVFEIVGGPWRRYEDSNNSFTVKADSPGYVMETSDSEQKDIVLSAANKWTGSWEKLPMTDKDGTPIYYIVEEVNVPSGYTVSYTGNDGVTSGQIGIINKKDKNSYNLPETGGSGTLPFITGGAFLMGFALLSGYFMRRRRGRRVE